MPLPYGFLKGQLSKGPQLCSKPHHNEVQYHLHASMEIDEAPGENALNVGTSDDDDSLLYKFVFEFHHPIIDRLKGAAEGQSDLTGLSALPALDFTRSDLLSSTGEWRRSDLWTAAIRRNACSTTHRLQRAGVCRLFFVALTSIVRRHSAAKPNREIDDPAQRSAAWAHAADPMDRR